MLYCAGCWAVVRIGVIDGGNTDADADANAVQAGFTPPKPRPGMNSYAFMWSIPNMVPLAPHVILRIWKAIRPFEFTATHGLLAGKSYWVPQVGQRRRSAPSNMIRYKMIVSVEKFLCLMVSN